MSAAEAAYALLGLGLIAYVVTAGADFGGGFWHLWARGPRAEAQREAIEHAIAPIWEANHVWLIFVIVVLFTLFPRAFAAISIALHVPMALALLGIVARGAAFSFRAYGLEGPSGRRRWGLVFAGSSALTPVCLGMTLAALSSGAIRVLADEVTTGYLAGWLSPFAWLTGLLSLALFALLAAVYMTVETTAEVREDFRRRALASEGIAGALAAATAWRAAVDAPALFARLSGSPWTWPLQGLTAAAALAVIIALGRRRFALARMLVIVQVGCVVLGWGAAMDGHFILPDVSLGDGRAPEQVFDAVFPALAAGGALLLPALWYLFRVFKSRA